MIKTDDFKICFIIAVSDEKVFEQCAASIEALKIPSGFTVDKVLLDNPCNFATAYNKAMHESDAKYKIYLRQETQILNLNILNDLLALFSANPEIGMVGVRGAKTLPVSGLWWDSNKKFGKLVEAMPDGKTLLSLGEVSGPFESVKVLDGILLATQVDLLWNHQLIGSLGFLESAHSLEFIKQGYQLAVPHQEDAWCLTLGRSIDVALGKDIGLRGFIAYYAKDFFPLVSLVIMTKNRADHLELTLKSALKQRYKNIEVIVGDYGADEAVAEMLAPYLRSFSELIYVKETTADVHACMANCLERASGDFVNFMVEGDILHVNKIGKMVHYSTELENVGLVTCYRQIIDDAGGSLEPTLAARNHFENDVALSSQFIIDSMLKSRCNVIGELAAVLLRKADLTSGLGCFAGKKYDFLFDVATWMHVLLQQKRVIYISELLCSIRAPSDALSADLKYQLQVDLDWLDLIVSAYENKAYLQDSAVFCEALGPVLSEAVEFIVKNHAALLLEDRDIDRVQNTLASACKKMLVSPVM